MEKVYYEKNKGKIYRLWLIYKWKETSKLKNKITYKLKTDELVKIENKYPSNKW